MPQWPPESRAAPSWARLLAVAATLALTAACGAGAGTSSTPTTTGTAPVGSTPPAATAPPPATSSPPPASSSPPPSSGTPQPRPSLLGHIVDRLPTARPVVALTFDAGANDAGVAHILSVLRSTGASGTFFLTGRWSQLFPVEARTIAASYPVGNHTMSHPDLTKLSPGAVRLQLEDAQRQIRVLTGSDPRPLFRFPYGAYDPASLGLVNGLGYAAIGWTVDTLGWEGTSGGQTAGSVLRRVLAGLQPGEIVLMHVGSNPTDHTTLDADALAAVIAEVRRRGYSFTTLPPYVVR